MRKVRLAFLWHMHQPPYLVADTGEHLLPWVRLHATRAYNDMAAALERHPGVRCTVNFTPVLLEQLADQASGIARDRFADLTAREPADLGPDERQLLVRTFFMVDWERHVRPVPRYVELLQKRGRDLRGVDLSRVAASFSPQELTDLQVHFNLAWMGFAAQAEPEVRALREKGRDFQRSDVLALVDAQRRIVKEIVPRWRALADRGQVELSSTPYFHPILPLVCDTDAARVALPGVALPPRFAHPEDARWHVREAIALHARTFGRPPAGMWPAEGSVSPQALEVLASEGVRWAASDEGVLLHSLPPDAPRLASLYHPWKVAAGGGELAMHFRDRSLSDVVGFTYARVPARDAVADFVGHVASIGQAWELARLEGEPTVGVFLDGENAWEHYPESGKDFLDGLYGALEGDARVETVTMSDATSRAQGRVGRIHSGSWIESSFRIWIGHAEDRKAWTALGRAHDAVEAAARDGRLAGERLGQARRHLYAAQASDWFWWYGDDFSTDLAAEFDALFRGHVLRAALLAGAPPPPEALEPIKRSVTELGAVDARAAREPSMLLSPVVDGRETTFFEWQGSGVYRPGQQRSSMYGGAQVFALLHYGFDLQTLYLRLDPAESPARAAELAARVRVTLLADGRGTTLELPVVPDGRARRGELGGAPAGEAAFTDVLEVSLPFAALGLRPGVRLSLAVHALREGVEVERLPRFGYLNLVVPGEDFELVHWRV